MLMVVVSVELGPFKLDIPLLLAPQPNDRNATTRADSKSLIVPVSAHLKPRKSGPTSSSLFFVFVLLKKKEWLWTLWESGVPQRDFQAAVGAFSASTAASAS